MGEASGTSYHAMRDRDCGLGKTSEGPLWLVLLVGTVDLPESERAG